MSLFLKMNEVRDQLTNSEQKIVGCILDNNEEVYNLSIQELAKKCNTSPSSVVRFCQKMGFEGFQDFKIELAKEKSDLNKNHSIVYEDVRVDDTIDDIVGKISAGNIKSIENTVELLDRSEVEKAVRVLNNANNILLYGVGASGLVAMDFQYKLMRINRNAFCYLDSHTQLSTAVNIQENDVAVGISHSGKTLEVFKAIEMANKKGAKTISITRYGDNPLSSISNIKLWSGGKEKNLRVGAIASRIAQLTVVDILFVGLAQKDFNTVSEYLKGTRMMVDDFKIKK
ncbi:MurR/RpiR family transcriptional regulator [Anaerosalibacter massiliensis]|uniref:MurR/RpiR family transcriptional regulator n=1 Tax=Anaerosalibacter massiliensis TaxID=1347392 RepID=A0A9X2S633_9FIRM|nr:MurR/RpiR family transcriptional regulator [Anaerosalibacter massiliensis]MCR2045208.1 MurR/RpiR family transcriptional regulator [Anaerosalibacter massiliensis]